MLREDINEAMKTAMRNKDTETLGTIRLVMAKLKDQDIAVRAKGNQDGINEPEITSMLQGMIKQRRESVALYEKGGRPELAAKESAEIVVIERFLPTQMDEAAVKAAIEKIIADTGAAGIKDMGKVMGALKSAYAGQMDFSAASGMVRGLLSSEK
ncbi:MAG: GatB/YqeY domain-containing protein [Bdellovibrionales bacterium]